MTRHWNPDSQHLATFFAELHPDEDSTGMATLLDGEPFLRLDRWAEFIWWLLDTGRVPGKFRRDAVKYFADLAMTYLGTIDRQYEHNFLASWLVFITSHPEWAADCRLDLNWECPEVWMRPDAGRAFASWCTDQGIIDQQRARELSCAMDSLENSDEV